jgi:hypothetical protein
LAGIPEGKGILGRKYVGCRIILILIFRNLDVGVRTGLCWLRNGQFVGICEYGNERSGSLIFVDFLDYLKAGLLLKRVMLQRVSKQCISVLVIDTKSKQTPNEAETQSLSKCD